MPRFQFTPHLARHLSCPPADIEAATLRDGLEQVFAENPKLRSYLLDDQGVIRQHVAVFVDNELLRDRRNLDVPLKPGSEVYVMQALSGG
jgi:hypothetical protein